MSDPMQQAKLEEAREYLRASRRKVQLERGDVILHRAINGWVIQTPDHEGFLAERLYEDDGSVEEMGVSLMKAIHDQWPDQMAVFTIGKR